MQSEFKSWWLQAIEDLKSAEYNFDGHKYDVASFLAQQSVEKALKAVHIRKYDKLLKVHDLVFLAKKLDLPDNLVRTCDKLTRIYTETRYPMGDVIPAKKFSKEKVKEFLEDAQVVIQWLKKML